MKYYYVIVMTSLLLMTSTEVIAQSDTDDNPNQLTIDAQLMSRGEVRQGGLPDNSPEKDDNRANFISNRARVSIGYERENLMVKMTAQHQGVWGAEGGGKFNIYEAWAQLKANNGLFARVGRQELVYDDERILGNNDWAMAAMFHDALKGGYENKHHKLHAVLAYNQNQQNVNGGTFYQNGSQPYKTMQTAWYHYDIPKVPLGLSLIFMNVGMQCGTPEEYNTIYQQLVGGYMKFNPSHLSLEAAYYRQLGKASLDYTSDHTLPIRSWMTSLKATCNFNRQLTGYVGYDYLSGDKEFAVPKPGAIALVKHSKMSGFTSIFGSSHKFYGAMYFFYVSSYYGSFSPGLQNLFGGTIYQPTKNFSCEASYHYLATATKLNNLNMTLGHEVEVRATYKLLKDTRIALGFTYMKGTETMEALKRSTAKHHLTWGWLMLNLSPRIFKVKW